MNPRFTAAQIIAEPLTVVPGSVTAQMSGLLHFTVAPRRAI
jgi:hypothetical protein